METTPVRKHESTFKAAVFFSTKSLSTERKFSPRGGLFIWDLTFLNPPFGQQNPYIYYLHKAYQREAQKDVRIGALRQIIQFIGITFSTLRRSFFSYSQIVVYNTHTVKLVFIFICKLYLQKAKKNYPA